MIKIRDQIYIEKRTNGIFMPVKNQMFVKPKGGFWTSSYIDKETICDWFEWCRYNEPGWVSGLPWFKLKVNPKASILVIDGINDLKKIASKFELKTNRRILLSAYLDWERISKSYDGVHLTEKGQIETRMPDDDKYSLYGFDIESTIWFRNVFDRVEFMGKIREINERGD